MPSSWGSSWPRDRTRASYLSCIGKWVLYHQYHLGNPLKQQRKDIYVFGPWQPNKTVKKGQYETWWVLRTRWPRSRCTWSTSLSTDTSRIHLQTQKFMQNISWEHTGVPDQQKRIYRKNQAKLGRTKELGGEIGMLVGLDLPSAGGGTEAGVWPPHQGNCLSQRRNV